ncbi:hypothetical protein NDU88_003637 [Pleurodeles waltl]|uniref:Uncharacterized protein n=1 Tax=Pleurodeles waltl TaxID=8319 RepID=A0AAV7W5M4_PLEWA|nr:hypothetical protein NDU88_003637 [Pleurodeles waltl]
MKVFNRLVMARPKSKGLRWKVRRTVAGIVDIPHDPVFTGPDFSLFVPPLDTINHSCGVGAVNTAIPRPPIKLITSFYQIVDKVPSLQQIAEQTGPEEQVVIQGCASEEDDERELCGGGIEGASVMRVDEGVKTVLFGPLLLEPTCEQPHKMSCPIPKNQESDMDGVMEESEPTTLPQKRKKREVLLHGCSNRELVVLSNDLGNSERRGEM